MTTSQIVTSSEENPIEYDRYNIDDYGWMDTTKQFISNLEGGFREKPYRVKNDDGTLGNWTIGHGFEYINGQPVTPQTTITEEQSLQILEDNPIRFSKEGLASMLQSTTPGFGPLVSIPVREAVLADPSLEETFGFMFPFGHPEGGLLDRVKANLMPAYLQNVENV